MTVTRRQFVAGAAALAVAPRTVLAAAPRAPGYALGFTSLTDETRIPRLPVDGRVPHWLHGTLMRNGPALFEVGERSFNHWFDGLAMLHAFSFTGGRVSYGNRFLRTSAYDAWKQEGVIKYSEFATDPCRSVFAGVASIPVLAPIPNANVSLERLASGFVAHTEVPIPVRFARRTLATQGVIGGSVGTTGTAHPHHDGGERFRFVTELVSDYGYRVLRNDVEIAHVKRDKPAYMHSFALTRRYVVLFEQPFRVDPLSFLSPERKPIIANFGWEPGEPSRVVVIDRRAGGIVADLETDPRFVFHHINAFERGGRIFLDVCAHPDNRVIDALYLKRVRAAERRLPKVEVRRLEVDLDRRRVHPHALGPDLELPRIDYERVNGRAYRYAYGVSARKATFLDTVVKLDTHTGGTREWREPGSYPGEPIFVRRPGAEREDDGVLLTVVLEARRKASSLVVLDARTLSELARASVPHHIPFGFHGLFS